jgi:hypothetical protein
MGESTDETLRKRNPFTTRNPMTNTSNDSGETFAYINAPSGPVAAITNLIIAKDAANIFARLGPSNMLAHAAAEYEEKKAPATAAKATDVMQTQTTGRFFPNRSVKTDKIAKTWSNPK